MYIRTKDGILDMNNTNKCIYVIRDKSVNESNEFRYVSYIWDCWRDYFLIDYQNCMLFSYNSAQNFISDLMKENLEYQNLVIELSPYCKDCKQSDNIAELCDRFVLKDCDIIILNKEHTQYHFEGSDEWFDITDVELRKGIYGAIWTDKGLIYVAKMNEEGDLCLI